MDERGTAPPELRQDDNASVAPSEPALAELADTYEVLGELGRGGSAVVFRARDRRLLREVALKVVRLTPALSASEQAAEIARLGREARTIARLQHPHIVAVYAVHELRDGIALAMQYVPGQTLKQAVAEQGAFAPDRAVRLLRDVAGALAHAHAHGVVHRDVKPENIFLDRATGRALLADFGAARAGEIDVRVTRTGTTVGTPAYMSPEQIDGGPVDARSDLYSLGLVAWEALTGHRPWEQAGLYQILLHQKHDTLPPIACVRPASAAPVPLRIEYVVDRLLEKRPGARWASADALVAQLEHAVLPADYKPWERTHRRRVAAYARGGPGARAGVPPAVFAAPTEQFRPGRPSAADAERSGEVPAAAAGAEQPDLPSWAHADRPARRRWWVAGIAAAAVAAMIPLARARPRGPDWREQLASSRTVQVASGQSRPSAPAPTNSASVATAAGDVAPRPPSADSAASGTAVAAAGSPSATPNPTPSAPATDVLAGAPAPGDTSRRILVPTLRALGASPRVSPSVVRPAATVPSPAARPTPRAPVAPPAASSARAAVLTERATIAAGARHTCALDAAGRALCWGANDGGQLGTGDLAAYDAPVSVTGDLRFTQVATGGAHTCALTGSGDAYCWGDDDHGQLGDGATSVRNAPVRVAGAWIYRALRAGLDHTCGLTTAAVVTCWGDNSRGQLGDGTTRAHAAPVPISGLRAAALAVGWRHSCALTPDGAAFCWGDNANGQLGDGTRAPRAVPVPVASDRRFVALAAGATHTCAATGDGETYCWGAGGADRLPRATPVRVDAPAAFSALAAGSVHTCGRTPAGAVYCWGRNPYGQLGDGTTADRWRPVRVPGGPFASVSASGAHTCAVADGAPVCWGYNVSGQLGDGTRTHHALPTRVARAAP